MRRYPQAGITRATWSLLSVFSLDWLVHVLSEIIAIAKVPRDKANRKEDDYIEATRKKWLRIASNWNHPSCDCYSKRKAAELFTLIFLSYRQKKRRAKTSTKPGRDLRIFFQKGKDTFSEGTRNTFSSRYGAHSPGASKRRKVLYEEKWILCEIRYIDSCCSLNCRISRGDLLRKLLIGSFMYDFSLIESKRFFFRGM